MNTEIPKKQSAVQLIGPDELTLNTDKDVHSVGPYQILCKVEAVGLCFSDLKLLKQFSAHARKGVIKSGIDESILEEVPSYVPGEAPTVPGHEAVVRVCALGDKVEGVTLGNHYLVETDYRWLPNEISNASFGYNFEGGLQQYVLMDQRVITSPEGHSMLVLASEKLSASAIALVEPWACVENAYAMGQRSGIKTGGQMLVVADEPIDEKLFTAFIARFGKPAKITIISNADALQDLGIELEKASGIASLPDAAFDDIIYFGADPGKAEALFPKVGAAGLFNIVQCGNKFGKDVVTQVGRVHYGGIRLVGTTGDDPSESMEHIPADGEIQKGDNIHVVGAAGPMGVMHVVRCLCQGVEDINVYASDLDDERMATLNRIAVPLAEKNKLSYTGFNPAKDTCQAAFDYVALMAPVPKLVAVAVKSAAAGAVVNVFAGIPAHVNGEIDLDAYIEKHLYFIGTSGSILDDMTTVLSKVEAGTLDTNLSVGAICGLNAAVEGIRAVENHLIAGKIIVYPEITDLPLVTLDKLNEIVPEVAGLLKGGLWTEEAEKKLLELKSA
ncbi:MAG: alcohol dehydrogenase catalytic domain-containing protein [Planctomycetes bacterium]|nr:alcohol dehydrogenase catalytic domain-containing protein [Planctomycetota bacterium]